MARIESATGWVETDCTFKHEGREYTFGGAMATNDRIVAYIGAPLPGMMRRYAVNDWHGNQIGVALLTASWTVGQWGTPMNAYRIRESATGRVYVARGQGRGMVATGRRAASDVLVA